MPELNKHAGLHEAFRRTDEARRTRSTSLSLAGLALTNVPKVVSQLPQLQSLDLSRNRITRLPKFLAQLPELRALFIHDNPGLKIPEEVLGPTVDQASNGAQPAPPKEILNYLREPKNLCPFNEAKLILVGQGGVGKTSLASMIVTGKFRKRPKRTEGIKISEWNCPTRNGRTIAVHIWDFGGQEIMHATHRFFLTRRSIYCLVLNRHDRDIEIEVDADYWLRLIRTFGGKNAPVIVVLNKQNSEPFQVNQRGWLAKYSSNIKGFIRTDCEDKKSITRLKNKISEELCDLPALKALFPRRWSAIKDKLLRVSKTHIDFDAFRELCIKQGEADPAAQSLLARLLHDLGIALNYRDDPRLRLNHILKPEWITRGIYALLHAFRGSHGLFTHTQAVRALKMLKYSAADTRFLLDLMENFELSISMGKSSKRVLIPELLDQNQPKEAVNFRPAECLNFGYRYAVLPEGLLSRFIVRTNHLSRESLRWKSGVILQHESNGCWALVKSAKDEVSVHVKGPHISRPDLLAIIRNNFEVIHSDYDIHPSAQGYFPGIPEKSWSLDELETLRKNGIYKVPVFRRGHDIIEAPISEIVSPTQVHLPQVAIFLSYAHKDQKHIKELRRHLKPAERNGLIGTWYDCEIIPGQEWRKEILDHLTRADMVVCQISPDFLDSTFCVLTELDIAITRKERGEAELVAYLLRLCAWKDEERLERFQMIGTKPLREFRDKDRFWHDVAEGIKVAVRALQEKRRRSLTSQPSEELSNGDTEPRRQLSTI